jgi:hypothetical protein
MRCVARFEVLEAEITSLNKTLAKEQQHITRLERWLAAYKQVSCQEEK